MHACTHPVYGGKGPDDECSRQPGQVPSCYRPRRSSRLDDVDDVTRDLSPGDSDDRRQDAERSLRAAAAAAAVRDPDDGNVSATVK